MKYVLILMMSIVLSFGNNTRYPFTANYAIIKDSITIGYSETDRVLNSCIKVHSVIGRYKGKLCGDFFIKKLIYTEYIESDNSLSDLDEFINK